MKLTEEQIKEAAAAISEIINDNLEEWTEMCLNLEGGELRPEDAEKVSQWVRTSEEV